MDGRFKITVCRGPECGDRRFSRDIHVELTRITRARGLDGKIVLDWQTCFGRCQVGPNVMVAEVQEDEDAEFDAIIPRAGGRRCLYNGVRPGDVERIIDQHVVGGRFVTELIQKL